VEVKASDVKKLREKTGAGMMDCKKALIEAKGDFPAAEKILKELGLAAAAKKMGRATNEGRIFTKVQDGVAAMAELSCETDFVARNKDFMALGEDVVQDVIDRDASADDAELQDKVKNAIGTIKENMALRRVARVTASANEFMVDYIHGDTGRIGVIVKLAVDKPEFLANDAVKQFAFDSALHVAAFNPMFLSEEKVDPEYLKEQEEIFTTQAKNLGKPEKVVQGIVKGKMRKHLSEISFVNQPFVKDEKKTVKQVADEIGKEIGGSVAITDFRYFRVGEEV
jgi:elongation factor Ts